MPDTALILASLNASDACNSSDECAPGQLCLSKTFAWLRDVPEVPGDVCGCDPWFGRYGPGCASWGPTAYYLVAMGALRTLSCAVAALLSARDVVHLLRLRGWRLAQVVSPLLTLAAVALGLCALSGYGVLMSVAAVRGDGQVMRDHFGKVLVLTVFFMSMAQLNISLMWAEVANATVSSSQTGAWSTTRRIANVLTLLQLVGTIESVRTGKWTVIVVVSIPGSLFLIYLNTFARRRILRLLDLAAEVELAASASAQSLPQLASDPQQKAESAPPAAPRRRCRGSAGCCSGSSCASLLHKKKVGPRGGSELRTVAVSASIRRAARGQLLCGLAFAAIGAIYVSLFATGIVYDLTPIGGFNVPQLFADMILWIMFASFILDLDYTHASVNRYLDPPASLAGSVRDLTAVTIFEGEPGAGGPSSPRLP